MKTAIRKHLRDFLAIIGLLILAGVVSVVILSNQRLTLPGWVPVVGQDFYEFNGEFTTAQAVTPGQGQTVNVAGVRVGEISRVELRGGRAVVGMKLDRGTVTVHRDATMLLRPKTGLKDMVVELDPGSADAPALPEGGTIPVSQTEPDVNLDELLASLDADTRTYLQALLQAGGEGLKGRGGDLGDTFRTFKPTASALRRISGALATRRTHIKRVMHNFSLLAEELGSKDDQLARFVNDSNAVLSIFARQEASIRATLRELPGALGETRTTLAKVDGLASELGPTLGALRPAARELGPALRQVRPFMRETTPVIRDRIRPLARESLPLVRELRPTMRDMGAAAPDLLTTLKIVNTAVDALAFNPPGVEEGYLFWFAWLNHLGASLFTNQDAHGPIRRGVLIASCDTLAVLDNVGQANHLLGTILALINVPNTKTVCPKQQAPAAAAASAKAADTTTGEGR